VAHVFIRRFARNEHRYHAGNFFTFFPLYHARLATISFLRVYISSVERYRDL